VLTENTKTLFLKNVLIVTINVLVVPAHLQTVLPAEETELVMVASKVED
jgi:hypothetical protein